MLRTEYIKLLASNAGFDLCGVTSCQHLPQNEVWFREWLDRGMHSSLSYLTRNLDKRFDPRRVVEGARTAVVCAVSYKNRASEGYPDAFPAKIASYACTTDYHTTIRKQLEQMLAALQKGYPGLQGRAFVDTAPLLEKQLAVEAGLGWIGRQSLLITPRHGSFVLLGELLLADEVDTYDSPFEGSRCGRCNNCIESCPTRAIVSPKVIDTTRCIACHTIEKQPDTEISLDGWIFGCDRCQSCCPYNHKAPMHTNSSFDLQFDPLAMDLDMWLSVDEEQFKQQFSNTPLSRSGLKRIQTNIQKNSR